jgi:hypothetical protein
MLSPEIAREEATNYCRLNGCIEARPRAFFFAIQQTHGLCWYTILVDVPANLGLEKCYLHVGKSSRAFVNYDPPTNPIPP